MRPREYAAFLARRSGVYLNRARRSVWVHGCDIDNFEAVAPLLKWLRTGISVERLLLTSNSPQTCAWLRARYPNDNTLPPPWDFGPLVARFIGQLSPAMIILIGDDSALGPAILNRARRSQIPVIVIDSSAPSCPSLNRIDHFCIRTAMAAASLFSAGVAHDRLYVTGSLRSSEGKHDAVEKALAATTAVIDGVIAKIPNARDPMPDRTAPRRMDAIAKSALGRRVVANRSARRLNGWNALRERLGRPETILCLGNGPSCEDPQLASLSYDALFRVNWRWLERGVLAQPDMVFVGDLRTTARMSSCVFGFRTIAWESEILLRHLLFRLSLRRLEYFTYERVSQDLNDTHWPTHPTNGVVMVATAVGLHPKTIIIAGMDLYQDPAGRYPGDPIGDNNYPQMHSREVEVRALSTILARFSGDTRILSAPLREALAAHGLRWDVTD